MMSPDENTTIRVPGKTEPPAKKAAKRSRKSSQKESSQKESSQKEAAQQALAQQAAPEAEQIEQAQEPIAVATVAMENPFADAAPEAPAPAAPIEPAEAAPGEPAQTAPVNLQTIANAYGEFTRKSIEQTGSFFEQLAGVRSLNRAFELQGEFAQQTFDTFVSESRRIRELHSELTMQRLRHLEGFMARMKPTRSS